MKYTRKELVHWLHTGTPTVTFTKVNGEKRVMKCTLQEGIAPTVETTTSKGTTRKVSDDVLAVWDVNKSAWRSFRIDSVENVEYI